MATYQFRLATLLRLRRSTRDARSRELAEAYRVESVLQEQRRQVEEEIGRVEQQCRRAARPGIVQVDRLIEAGRYKLSLHGRATQLERQRQGVEEEIARRRGTLVEAEREVRVLEKLEERQARRHRREESRREIRQLDEVAGLRLTAREDAP